MSFILGGVWRCYEYRAWLPLSDYKVDAQSPVLEKRLWDVFPARSFYFWPWLVFKDAKNIKDFLERDMPVSVQMQKLGFGKYRTVIRWLTPWIKVAWRGRVWCISKDGKMWNADEMPIYAAQAKGPVWILNNDKKNNNVEAEVEVDDNYMIPSGVFKSPVDTRAINKFLSEYQAYDWFSLIDQIIMDRRAGMDLFKIRLALDNQVFEILIQDGKYAGQDLGAAVNDILKKLAREGGNHVIDATYEGKILLRKLSSKIANRKEGE